MIYKIFFGLGMVECMLSMTKALVSIPNTKRLKLSIFFSERLVLFTAVYNEL
jgi:hypothetical protein